MTGGGAAGRRQLHLTAPEARPASPAALLLDASDGSQRPGIRGVTTPLDIASTVSKALAKKAVVAKVRGRWRS